MLRLPLPPPMVLLHPPVEGRADLSSVRSFLILLCWLVEDLASWLKFPWTISLLCVAAVAKFSKWVSKSSVRFAPPDRRWVSPLNGEGTVVGSMQWMSWAAAEIL